MVAATGLINSATLANGSKSMLAAQQAAGITDPVKLASAQALDDASNARHASYVTDKAAALDATAQASGVNMAAPTLTAEQKAAGMIVDPAFLKAQKELNTLANSINQWNDPAAKAHFQQQYDTYLAAHPELKGSGIINGTPPNAAVGGGGQPQATTMPAAPVMRNIQPVLSQLTANDTVQGQLGQIMKTGNPLLEAAKARAMQAANARGMQNTSMAAQGGEEAMLNAALPIATADAAAYQKQNQLNQGFQNEFLSLDKAGDIDLNKQYQAFTQNNFIVDKDLALKKYISDTGNSTQMKIAAINDATANTAIQARLTEAAMNIGSNEKIDAARRELGYYETNTNAATSRYNADAGVTAANISAGAHVAGAEIAARSGLDQQKLANDNAILRDNLNYTHADYVNLGITQQTNSTNYFNQLTDIFNLDAPLNVKNDRIVALDSFYLGKPKDQMPAGWIAYSKIVPDTAKTTVTPAVTPAGGDAGVINSGGSDTAGG